MNLVRIGRLGRAHGVRGEITVDSSLTPLELEAMRRFTWRGADGETRSLVLESARAVEPRNLLKFQGVHNREQASTLTLGELLFPRDQLPDPGPGVAYTFQLLGLEVRTVDGRRLGTLHDIVSTAAHPIYVVRDEAKELLVPATEQVVREVDLQGGAITVELPAGLEEVDPR